MRLHEISVWRGPYGHNLTYSDVEPGLSEYAFEAWERMTTAGCTAHCSPDGDIFWGVGGDSWFTFGATK